MKKFYYLIGIVILIYIAFSLGGSIFREIVIIVIIFFIIRFIIKLSQDVSKLKRLNPECPYCKANIRPGATTCPSCTKDL